MFEGKKFVIEHALNMYAYSYAHFPASGIYDDNSLQSIKEVTDKCHIYIIGLFPKIINNDIKKEGSTLTTSHTVLGEKYELKWEVPEYLELKTDGEYWYLDNNDGNRYAVPDEEIFNQIVKKAKNCDFKVLYIGQSYGKDGSRNAIDRLKKHETLQKIALSEKVEPDYNLHLLLLEIQPDNRMIVSINGRAEDDSTSNERISKGTFKLFNTDEKERITLYEASLIRYFQPKYNKEFKDSFPSTNMKVLNDCYDKDFAAVTAEILLDDVGGIPYKLYSDAVQPTHHHMAIFDLHKEADRKVFFSDC